MTDITANNTDWTELQQAEDMAYFRAEACLLSPESYSLDEKSEDIRSPTSATTMLQVAFNRTQWDMSRFK